MSAPGGATCTAALLRTPEPSMRMITKPLVRPAVPDLSDFCWIEVNRPQFVHHDWRGRCRLPAAAVLSDSATHRGVARVAMQSPVSQDGFIREALTSLYGLFAATRDILSASRPSLPVSGDPTVEFLAITMLNRELRPFLSKWHPWLREYEKAHPDAPESGWPGNDACRAELRVVQIHLVEFTLGFARLPGVRNARSAMALDNLP